LIIPHGEEKGKHTDREEARNMDITKVTDELADNLMKVVKRLSNKEDATAEEIEALSAVANVLTTWLLR